MKDSRPCRGSPHSKTGQAKPALPPPQPLWHFRKPYLEPGIPAQNRGKFCCRPCHYAAKISAIDISNRQKEHAARFHCSKLIASGFPRETSLRNAGDQSP